MTIIVSSIVLKKDAFVFITHTEVVPKEVNLLVLKVPFVVQEPINTFLGLSRPLFDGIYVFLHPLYGTRVSLVYHSCTDPSAKGLRPVRSSLTLVSPRGTTATISHSKNKYFQLLKFLTCNIRMDFGSPSILP